MNQPMLSAESNNVALEEEARQAEDAISEVRYKLVEVLPILQRIRAHFASGKRGSAL
jgi:hypothetical protein